MSTEAEFLHAYEGIKLAYKTAMKQVDVAIALEEQERAQDAINAYEKSLKLIDETFALPVGLPDDIDDVNAEWLDACTIIQKLKSAKTEVSYRLKVLRAQLAPIDMTAIEVTEQVEEPEQLMAGGEPAAKRKPLLQENPATYYDISTATGTKKTYKEILVALREVIATKEETSGVMFDTLFQTTVKLYKIQPNGVVVTLTGDNEMTLVMCNVDAGKWQFLHGIVFIQCTLPAHEPTSEEAEGASAITPDMIWIYPLIPTATNCFRTDYGAFIFPDIETTELGSAFGIMITKSNRTAASTPSSDLNEATAAIVDEEEQLADLQQFFLDLLEAVLAGKVEELHAPGKRPPRDTSQQVSSGIVCAADFIARNLIKGAEKTGDLMMSSTPYLISKMNPAPADTPPVSSKVQTTVEVAQKVTHCAVGVTGWVAGKVGTASLAIGRYLAPHIQTQGSRLLEKGFGYGSIEAQSTMESALAIAAGAVEGFSTVYNGLETSAKILGNSLSENSVKIIEHKYGSSAANVAAGTFDTFGNAFVVSQNVNYITPKGIAKKMAKRTGEAVVDDYKRNLRKDDESHFITAGALYPDLRSLKEKTL